MALPALANNKLSLLRTATRKCRNVQVAAASRPTWLPGTPPPAHLHGTLAGDYGFDPLGLGQDPARLKWYAEAEKMNGRWAMMGVTGILGAELLGVDAKWYEAGAAQYGLPLVAQIPILFLVMGYLEMKRYQGFKATGCSGLLEWFPFDPLGMNSPSMATKEVKHCRLAMIAFVGFAMQALVTRTSPIEGLWEHIADPLGHNIGWYLRHLPETLSRSA